VQVWSVQAGEFSPVRRLTATFSQPTLLKYFQQIVDAWQPDLVHIQHLMGLPVSIVDILRRKKIPYLIYLHDFWWICANAQLLTNYDQSICNGPNAFVNCARCFLARANLPDLWPAVPPLAALSAWRNRRLWAVVRAADCMTVPSAFVKDWYTAHGFPLDKTQVLPLGIDTAQVIKQSVKDAHEPFRFGYIGGISPQKGLHVLIEAFNALNQPAELWIAGDELAFPDYVAQLRNMAGPSVHFLGTLDRTGVWQTLAQLDVAVVPSLWYETFSIIISEAFAAGVPVIASKIGPLADRVRHGIDGLLFEPGNIDALSAAMGRLLLESDLLADLRENIQPPLSLDDHVKQLQEIYEQVLSAQ
jgi:glycosyltransferase involved in cell wall biosynthesis